MPNTADPSFTVMYPNQPAAFVYDIGDAKTTKAYVDYVL